MAGYGLFSAATDVVMLCMGVPVHLSQTCSIMATVPATGKAYKELIECLCKVSNTHATGLRPLL
jgi:hypothetical protein